MKIWSYAFITIVMTFSWLHSGPALSGEGGTAHDFSFESIDGSPLPLAEFRGKAVLVVNTASRCGFTKQYAGLQKLYDTYKDRGLVVLGVPANNFANQEPGTEAEIKEFCEGVYRITFPLTEKTDVVGKAAHPFYKWAAAQKKGGIFFSTPRWNFHKYLIARDGSLAGAFASTVTPESAEMVEAVEAVLAESYNSPASPDK